MRKKLSAAWARFAVVVLLLSGCSSGGVPGPVVPTTQDGGPRTITPVTITGVALGPTGAPYPDVAVGFRQSDCAGCRLIATKTDASGAYAVALTPGGYLAVCIAPPFTCTFKGSQVKERKLVVTMDVTIDIVVTRDAPPPTPSTNPPPSPDPAPPTPGPNADSYSLSGHVRTREGQPVPGITIQLLPPGRVGQTLFTTADTDGSYGFDANYGSYTVVCQTPNPDTYMCGPVGGDGTGPTVDLATPGQVIDFLVCHSQDYPGCLTR